MEKPWPSLTSETTVYGISRCLTLATAVHYAITWPIVAESRNSPIRPTAPGSSPSARTKPSAVGTNSRDRHSLENLAFEHLNSSIFDGLRSRSRVESAFLL